MEPVADAVWESVLEPTPVAVLEADDVAVAEAVLDAVLLELADAVSVEALVDVADCAALAVAVSDLVGAADRVPDRLRALEPEADSVGAGGAETVDEAEPPADPELDNVGEAALETDPVDCALAVTEGGSVAADVALRCAEAVALELPEPDAVAE